MEALSLEDKINMKISQHILLENIINSCVEKFHSDVNIDANSKKDFFNKCIQAKVNIYNKLNEQPNPIMSLLKESSTENK